MIIQAGDLDREAKSAVRDIILNKIFKEYHGLPLPNETEKIMRVITPELTKELEHVVEEYYEVFNEHTGLKVCISPDEYRDIYLQRI